MRANVLTMCDLRLTVHLVADQRQSCIEQAARHHISHEQSRFTDHTHSYVQELEARLLHMESLFTQIAPVLQQMDSSAPGAPATGPATAVTAVATDQVASSVEILRTIAPKEQPSEPSTPVKAEDDVSESFGQLALDEYGHMRWIGGSSTMSLIQSFRAITSSPLHRISPMEEDPQAPGPSVNKLYFPASVFFGKVHALPGPEEVEYPERDLADKLVCTCPFIVLASQGSLNRLGRCLFHAIPLPYACGRQTFVYTAI